MVQLTDTHSHLDFEAFDDDRDEVVSRAKEAGLVRVLNPGIDMASSTAAVNLAETYEFLYAAVGVHPNSAMSWDQKSYVTIRALSSNPNVVAVGEIGLDYYRDRASRELQREIFCKQLSLASEMSLPVVIYNREASDDILDILAEWQSNLVESGSRISDRPGVLHSFSGDPAHAIRAIEHRFLIGITGPVTFKQAVDLQNLVVELPLNSLLIETDAPFLAPHPHRGRRNEPANVRWVAEKIAALKGLDVDIVGHKTTENAARLFGW